MTNKEEVIKHLLLLKESAVKSDNDTGIINVKLDNARIASMKHTPIIIIHVVVANRIMRMNGRRNRSRANRKEHLILIIVRIAVQRWIER